MHVQVPTQIGVDGLVEDVHHISAAHGHMVLEAILADVLHELLQVVNLCHCYTAIHAIGVVGELTLAQIGLDSALRIVCRDAEEGEGTFRDFGIDSTKGVDLTQCAS